MEVVYERCAGLDVGKDEVVACVRVPDGAGGRRGRKPGAPYTMRSMPRARRASTHVSHGSRLA